jgi:hypothetical protein
VGLVVDLISALALVLVYLQQYVLQRFEVRQSQTLGLPPLLHEARVPHLLLLPPLLFGSLKTHAVATPMVRTAASLAKDQRMEIAVVSTPIGNSPPHVGLSKC